MFKLLFLFFIILLFLNNSLYSSTLYNTKYGDLYVNAEIELNYNSIGEKVAQGDYTQFSCDDGSLSMLVLTSVYNTDVKVIEHIRSSERVTEDCMSTECNQIIPDGFISYPIDDNGTCATYADELKHIYASAGVSICDDCFAEPYNETNCQPPNILDTSVSPATCTQCSPMSDTTIDIPKDACDGSITNNDEGYKGLLSYQECDNTCYVLERIALTCDDISTAQLSQCDTSVNNFTFDCTEASTLDSLPTFTSSCTPKPNCNDLDPDDHIPTNGNWIYDSLTDSDTCEAKVDGNVYIGFYFKTPSIQDCPDVTFCYLELNPDSDNPDDSDNSDDSDNPDDTSDNCKGIDTNTISYSGTTFDNSSYTYYGIDYSFKCNDLLLESNIDSIYTADDLGAPACENKYCYVHYVTTPSPLDDTPETNTTTPPPSDDIPETNTTTPPPYNDILEKLDFSNKSLKDIDEALNKNNTDLNEFKDKSLEKLDLTNSSLRDIDDTLNNTNSKIDTTNSKIDDTNKKLDTTNDNLVSIGSKIDTTNNKLTDIQIGIGSANDKLSEISNALNQEVEGIDESSIDSVLADRESFIDDIQKQYTDFYDNVKGQQEQMVSLYDSTKALYEDGFQFNNISSSSSDDGCFSAVVFGVKITLRICPYLEPFKPIVYFILTIYFMVLSIQLSMKYILKGD